MKQPFVSAAVLISLVMVGTSLSGAQGKPSNRPPSLGTVSISTSVILTSGERLNPGTYDVRLTRDESTSGAGLVPGRERRGEFLRRGLFRRGRVLGTEVVHVVPASDVGKIQDQASGVPSAGNQKMEITPHDFLRIWFNEDETHYLIYLKLAG